MVEAIIRALLYICAIVLCYFLILWVLTTIGIAIPAMVAKIILVMLVLICILVLYRLFAPWFGSWGA
jgi:hypothetical protein